jgi:NADH pyrophosphatase NudC (nudix superfamily)
MSRKIEIKLYSSENQEEASCVQNNDQGRNIGFEIKAGRICPKCQQEKLDYNGLLQIICPNCGVIDAGCFT